MPEIIIDNPNDPNAQSTAGNVKATIPAMLKCVNSAGYVTGAADILDERLNKDQQTINEETVKFIPLGAILNTSPEIQQSSCASHNDSFSYSYVWDYAQGILLLKVVDPSQHVENAIKYYMSWNATPTGMASDEVDKDKDFFYTVSSTTLTLYHWVKPSGVIHGNIVPTGSNDISASILTVNASNPTVNSRGQYVFNCDTSVATIYDHINNGGLAIVKGNLAGTFQAILTGISNINSTYTITGITEINNTIYTLDITTPAGTAPSTLYATKAFDSRFNSIETELNDVYNDVQELNFQMIQSAGASKFILLSEMLPSTVLTQTGMLNAKESGHTYTYVWETPKKRVLVKDVYNATTKYWTQWSEQVMTVGSVFLKVTEDFFYTVSPSYLTIYHWQGTSIDGDLVSVGSTDITSIEAAINEINAKIGIIPAGSTIGGILTAMQTELSGDTSYIQNWLRYLTTFLYPVIVWDSNNTLPQGELWKEGQLWYNTSTNKMMMCVADQTSFSVAPTFLEYPFSVMGEGFFFDTQHKQIYVYLNGEFQRLGNGGGGSSVTVDSALSPTSTNPVENRAIKSEINRLEGLIEEIVDPYDYSSDPRYPEYSGYGNGGAKGDGIPYYDWPLACFNGIEDSEVTIEQTASSIKVYAPSERILDKYGLTIDYQGESLEYCSDSVVFNSATNKFLLYADSKYYDKWANSDVWNDPDTGEARVDTVYSNIRELTAAEKTYPGADNYTGVYLDESQTVDGKEKVILIDPNDEYPIAERSTWIYTTTGGLVLISDTMTDDGAALSDWFNARKGKVALLRPNAIYYFRKIKDGSTIKPVGHNCQASSADAYASKWVFDFTSNTKLNGNNATLFPHRIDAGWPNKRTGTQVDYGDSAKILNVSRRYGSRNTGTLSGVEITNVNIKSLTDKDSHSVGGSNSKMSSSSSNIEGIVIGTDYDPVDGINISNVETYNINSLISCSRSNGNGYPQHIYVSNSKGINVVSQFLAAQNSVYDNIEIQAKSYMGHDGAHIFYGTIGCNNLHIKNSIFSVPDPYREVQITYHASSSVPSGSHYDVYYENCRFEGAGLLFGASENSGGRLTVHFIDCKINKNFDYYCGSVGVISSADYVFLTANKAWEFIRCNIDCGGGVVSNDGDYKLTLEDVAVNSTNTTPSYKSLFGWDASGNAAPANGVYTGLVSVSNFKTNYLGPLGFYLEVDTTLDETAEQLKAVKKLLLGADADIPFRSSPIENPAVDDMYLDISTFTLYKCTAIGTPGYLALTLNMGLNGAPYSVTQTITLNDDEVIPITFTNVNTLEDLEGVITKAMEDAGYKLKENLYTSLTPGHFYCAPSTNGSTVTSVYLIITSKKQGALKTYISSGADKPDCVDVYGDQYPITIRGKAFGSSWYNSLQGTAPIWQAVDGVSGLIGMIEGLDSRVEALEE